MKKFITSRKFILAALYGVGMFIAKYFDMKFEPAEILGMATVVAGYIGGEAFIDAKNKPAN